MYNYVEHDPAAVGTMIDRRTAAFARDADVRDPESLARFRVEWEPVDGKLIDEVPDCPFLGRVAPGRVGCLVHPLLNEGVDGRDCGVYDRQTCDDYLCAAHQVLRPIEKWLVIEAVQDSYTYGLVVTDPLFVRQLFERAADLSGAAPLPARVMRPASVRAARGYFRLKNEWPYGASDAVFGQVTSGKGLETPRRAAPTEGLDVPPAPWDTILRCLGTAVRDVAELEAARERVQREVQRFADAVRGPAS